MSQTRALPSSLLRHPWTVPAVVAAAVATAFLAPPLLASAGDADLPDLTAEELLAQVIAAEPVPLAGSVVYTARLGLPEIPLSEATGADPIALLGGSSTLRVWTDGAERSRVSLLGATSEYSVVADAAQLWTYSSSDDAVTHYALSAADQARLETLSDEATERALAERAATLPTPQEAARMALAKAEELSTVSLDAETTVAGRPAYQLVVSPRTAGSLVARVIIAVDAETSVPLRVQTWSTQDAQAPAIEIGFTDIAFVAPDDAVLSFSAPSGATVREVVVPLPAEPVAEPSIAPEDLEGVEGPQDLAAAGLLPPGVTITGTGWSTVVELADLDVAALLAGDPAALAGMAGSDRLIGSQSGQELVDEFMPSEQDGSMGMDLDASALYQQLTREVDGGRLLSSALLSVLITDDGRVLVGAVPAQTLRDLA